jgi:hypothetical protein
MPYAPQGVKGTDDDGDDNGVDDDNKIILKVKTPADLYHADGHITSFLN